MINHQELREYYKPDNIKILLIAEAPPKAGTFFYSGKSFFYTYTKQVFETFFKEEINGTDFLDFFKAAGFYLDDLSHVPMTFNEICLNKDSLINNLMDRITIYNPEAIIITPRRIERFVRQAINTSDSSNNISPKNIFPLYFPGNGWQNKYKSGLKSAIYYLIRNNIVNFSNQFIRTCSLNYQSTKAPIITMIQFIGFKKR